MAHNISAKHISNCGLYFIKFNELHFSFLKNIISSDHLMTTHLMVMTQKWVFALEGVFVPFPIHICPTLWPDIIESVE